MGRNSRLASFGLTAGLCAILAVAAGCNEHSVEIVQTDGAVEVIDRQDPGAGQELDLLWTIDNSGSMCRSQEILRDGIEGFVNVLSEVNIDFHIAVTTSHMVEDSRLEPVAKPGQLQATPQPIPGFEDECRFSVYTSDEVAENDQLGPEDVGQPDLSRVGPIQEAIDTAVQCTESPGDWQHLSEDFNEDELRCTSTIDVECNSEEFPSDADYCTCPEDNPGAFPNCIDCSQFVETDDQGEVVDEPTIEDFFPDREAYRDIPLVLRSRDYERDDGTLRIEDLRDDFACMSLVGTRGDGFEQGLKAAAKALSPEMTGGADVEDRQDMMENPENYRDEYPNAGFLRREADTGVIFVSDENDCSYEDGEAVRGTLCSVHNCTIQENLGEDGALMATEDLADQFMTNVVESRGVELGEGDDPWSYSDSVLPVSIHGASQNLTELEDRIGEPIPDQCPDEQVEWFNDYFIPGSWNWGVPPSCRSEIGVAWSGHRYESFIRQFDQFFPRPIDEDESNPLPGEICNAFGPVLEDIAEFFQAEAGQCIQNVYECSGPDAACPDDPVRDQPGQCTRYPGYDEGDEDAKYYCDTGIEVRLAPGEERTREDLQDTGYCLEDTFGAPGFEDTCLVDPAKYSWGECEGTADGIRLTWTEEDWVQIIGEDEIVVRYANITQNEAGSEQAEAENDQNGGDSQNDQG